jgi:hypothetical protein
MVDDTQNYWVFGLFPSSRILLPRILDDGKSTKTQKFCFFPSPEAKAWQLHESLYETCEESRKPKASKVRMIALVSNYYLHENIDYLLHSVCVSTSVD